MSIAWSTQSALTIIAPMTASSMSVACGGTFPISVDAAAMLSVCLFLFARFLSCVITVNFQQKYSKNLVGKRHIHIFWISYVYAAISIS